MTVLKELTTFQRRVKLPMLMVLAAKDAESYVDRYHCRPPPLFIVIISVVQVCLSICVTLLLEFSSEPSPCGEQCAYATIYNLSPFHMLVITKKFVSFLYQMYRGYWIIANRS